MSFDHNMIFLTFEMQMDDEHLTESDTSSTDSDYSSSGISDSEQEDAGITFRSLWGCLWQG